MSYPHCSAEELPFHPCKCKNMQTVKIAAVVKKQCIIILKYFKHFKVCDHNAFVKDHSIHNQVLCIVCELKKEELILKPRVRTTKELLTREIRK